LVVLSSVIKPNFVFCQFDSFEQLFQYQKNIFVCGWETVFIFHQYKLIFTNIAFFSMYTIFVVSLPFFH